MKRIIFTLALSAALSILPGMFMAAFWHEASMAGYRLHWTMWLFALAPILGGFLALSLIGQALTFKAAVKRMDQAAAVLNRI